MTEKLSERLWNYGDTELARMAEASESRIEVLESRLGMAISILGDTRYFREAVVIDGWCQRRDLFLAETAALAAKSPTPKLPAPKPQIVTTGWPADKEPPNGREDRDRARLTGIIGHLT